MHLKLYLFVMEVVVGIFSFEIIYSLKIYFKFSFLNKLN
jgi:hypothetical protein